MGHQGPKVASLCLLLPAFLSCRAQLQCGEPGTSGSGVGVEQLFVIWTDYKNLHSARHLHSHQAHWAPFLGHFNYTLTYCPGSHNIKPEALSRQFAPEGPPFEPETILSLWFNALNPTQVMVHLKACLHPIPPGLKSFCGDIRARCPVILASTVLSDSSSNGFGGPQCPKTQYPKTPAPLWLPAPSVYTANHPINLLLACCTLFPFPVA